MKNTCRTLLKAIAAALAVGVSVAHTALQAAETTQVDVLAKVTNDGRFLVTETHQLTIDKGYESDFREFGLGVDQTVIMRGVTRISEDGTEVALADHGAADKDVDGPDQFRYYPLGHVYYRYPLVQQKTPLRYRFEYEIANAVSPAWNIAAGDGELDSDYSFGSPLRRLSEHRAAFLEAWPDPWRRYRLDHSLLMPGRKLNREQDLRINYTLEFGTAWREVALPAEFARVSANDEYRVRRLYEYLPPGEPANSGLPPARERWNAVLLVLVVAFVVAPIVLLILVLFDWFFGDRLDAVMVNEQLSAWSPEEVFGLTHDSAPSASLEDVLGRLAGEGKLRIEFAKPPQPGQPSEVTLELLVPWESLPKLERALLKEVFADDTLTTTSQRVRERSAAIGYDLISAWWKLRHGIQPEEKRTGLTLLGGLLLASGVLGAFQQVAILHRDEEIIAALLTNAVAFIVTAGWPKQWWHAGHAIRGLLLHMFVMMAIFAALHLAINRPYPAATWRMTALTMLAFFGAQLWNSRMPRFGKRKHVRQFARIRQYAERELQKPEPRLDDHCLPQLLALDLGPQIERWRQAHPATSQAGSGHGFTGQLPESFPAPAGWSDVFLLSAEEEAAWDEDEEEFDEDDEEEDEDE